MGASDFTKLPHIGEALKRKEDYRYLIGAGQYTDDVVLQGQTYGVFLRSPHAHARIKSIDLTAARAAPGVVARAGRGPPRRPQPPGRGPPPPAGRRRRRR